MRSVVYCWNAPGIAANVLGLKLNSSGPQAQKRHILFIYKIQMSRVHYCLSQMVGLEEFESSSIAPEATSLDQASRQPHVMCFDATFLCESIK